MKTKCPQCGTEYTPGLALRDDWNEKKRQWTEGQRIQNVWPHALPIQREQLQTGICSDACWDAFLEIGS